MSRMQSGEDEVAPDIAGVSSQIDIPASKDWVEEGMVNKIFTFSFPS